MVELAIQRHIKIELAVLGGAAMVLGYSARVATLDVDAVILSPADKNIVRDLVKTVADEYSLPADWLNDAIESLFAWPVRMSERVRRSLETWPAIE